MATRAKLLLILLRVHTTEHKLRRLVVEGVTPLTSTNTYKTKLMQLRILSVLNYDYY